MTVIIRRTRFSFPVIGCPVSMQSSRDSKQQYKALVTEAARGNVDKPVEASRKVKIEIDWFSQGFVNKPDVDNIVKLIQDALKDIVFVDDGQVESITARKHDSTSVMSFTKESLSIIEPIMNGHQEYIFVRIY